MPFLLWTDPQTEPPQDNPASGRHPLVALAVSLNWSVASGQNVKSNAWLDLLFVDDVQKSQIKTAPQAE